MAAILGRSIWRFLFGLCALLCILALLAMYTPIVIPKIVHIAEITTAIVFLVYGIERFVNRNYPIGLLYVIGALILQPYVIGAIQSYKTGLVLAIVLGVAGFICLMSFFRRKR